MVSNCLKNKTSFVVVTALLKSDVQSKAGFEFSNVGTLVNIVDADITDVGMLTIRCIGQHRVKIDSFTQQSDGLVIGVVADIPDDLSVNIPEDLISLSNVLRQLFVSFNSQNLKPNNLPEAESYQFDDSTWVGNRWIDLLDLPLLQKLRLMQMDSPILRLELIQDILEANKIV